MGEEVRFAMSAVDILMCSGCNTAIDENCNHVQCSGLCDGVFHLECSSLKKSELKLLENKCLKWFCSSCTVISTNLIGLLTTLKNSVLVCQDQLFKHGETLDKLHKENAALRAEISVIKRNTEVSSNSDTGNDPSTSSRHVTKVAGGPIPVAKKTSFSEAVKQQTNVAVNSNKNVTPEVTLTLKTSDGQVQAYDKNLSINTSYKNTIRKKQTPLIIGTHSKPESDTPDSDDDFVSVKKVRRCNIHITRVKPSVSIEKIRNYVEVNLKNKEVDNDIIASLILEKLTSKYPENYSSFKLSILSTTRNILLDPTFWPDGVAVRNFFSATANKFFRKTEGSAIIK